MAVQTNITSAAELWQLMHDAADDAPRYELSEGHLIEMSPTGMKHGVIAARLLIRLGSFVEQQGLGQTAAAETGYILFTDAEGRDTLRAPDVSFVAAQRLTDGLPDQYARLAPDLAAEIVSPHDRAQDIQRKVADYLKAEIPLFWLIYPETRSAEVYHHGGITRLTETDSLDGFDVVPGFTLALRDLF